MRECEQISTCLTLLLVKLFSVTSIGVSSVISPQHPQYLMNVCTFKACHDLEEFMCFTIFALYLIFSLILLYV